MENEDLELYRNLSKTENDLNIPSTEDYFNLSESEKRLDEAAEALVESIEIKEVERTLEERKRRRSEAKAKSRRMRAMVAALMLVGSYGVYAINQFVKPYVDDAREYEKNRTMLASMHENYSKNAGYLKRLDITLEPSKGLFDDEPREFDYNNPENIYTTSTGAKAGPIVEYYDGLDEFIRDNNNGVGYYETVYRNNQIRERFGMKPEDIHIYTQEELENMFGNEKNVSLGGK